VTCVVPPCSPFSLSVPPSKEPPPPPDPVFPFSGKEKGKKEPTVAARCGGFSYP